MNCLEPHPHIPILATSGLDCDVKVWAPSCEDPPSLQKIENVPLIEKVCVIYENCCDINICMLLFYICSILVCYI